MLRNRSISSLALILQSNIFIKTFFPVVFRSWNLLAAPLAAEVLSRGRFRDDRTEGCDDLKRNFCRVLRGKICSVFFGKCTITQSIQCNLSFVPSFAALYLVGYRGCLLIFWTMNKLPPCAATLLDLMKLPPVSDHPLNWFELG